MAEGSDWISKKIDKFVVVNKKLGKGAFGTVFRGFCEDDESKLVAAKQIPIKNISNSDKMIKLIKREINNLQKLDSKYTEYNESKQTITEDKYQYEEKAEQLVKQQIDNEKMRKNIMKVNEYILYERNVSFFYNFVIQKIIKSFNSNILSISGDLYFRIIFAICKCQNINLERVNQMLKSQTSDFNPQLWRNYQQSREFIKTQKTITQDIYHSKKFFQELLKKTSEVVENSLKKDPSKESLKKFQEVMNDKLTQDSNFKQVYQQSLAELLNNLKQLAPSTNKKDILIIIRYIIVCQNPYSEFNNSDFDFNKFYEEIDNCQLDQLREEIVKKLNQISQ
ncbi:hypothetical protein ABPG72_004178 [Tetrahymena utriculariae]